MSLGMHICCDVPDCDHKAFIDRKVYTVDRVYPIGTAYLEVDDCVLEDGSAIQNDLRTAACAAGWHWDGREWRCKECTAKAVEALAASYDALDTESIGNWTLSTVDKLERVAKMLNV